MREGIVQVARLLFFAVLLCAFFGEFAVWIMVLDYMGQYVIPYDPETFLMRLLGTSAGFVLLNRLFMYVQAKNTLSELIYAYVLTAICIVYTLLLLFMGSWLIDDYRYDYAAYGGFAVSHIWIVIQYIRVVRRNLRMASNREGV